MGDVRKLIQTAEELGPSAPLVPLPSALQDYSDEERPEVRGPWEIDSLGSADWALKRMAEGEAEIAEVKAQAEAAKSAIDRRAAELIDRAARLVGFMRFKLARYAEAHRGEMLRGKRKSHDFIHGRIQFRSSPERLVVVDKAALEAWLVTRPVEAGLYRQKIEPEMTAIQEQFQKDGVIPPGCEVKRSEETIRIEANAPETALARG